ncbi:cleavage and polyadenylation specificity factor subunit 6-like [Balaenoptera musculus]|uniref:Cleavage and polyadenylation specificity factor subunit 6-like n=1 Tax=Balaenoptera musculus TaxID=9771 RepID=A0A8B8YQJ0_BALMU|nr:cleavage and polyadenylation specificity factor subunit 6-like [Balaenoptera musculus]
MPRAGGQARLGKEQGSGRGAGRRASVGGGVRARLAPAAGASGRGAGLGAGPGGWRLRPFAGPPAERARAAARGRPPRPGARVTAAAPLLPRPRLAGSPAPGDSVTELGRQRCIVGAFKAAGSAARPLGLSVPRPIPPGTAPTPPGRSHTLSQPRPVDPKARNENSGKQAASSSCPNLPQV